LLHILRLRVTAVQIDGFSVPPTTDHSSSTADEDGLGPQPRKRSRPS